MLPGFSFSPFLNYFLQRLASHKHAECRTFILQLSPEGKWKNKKTQTSGFAVIREANRPLQMNSCQGERECPTRCAGPTSTFLISPATASLLVSVFSFIYTNFWQTEARFWVQLFRCKSRATPSNSVYLPSVHTAPNTLLPVLTLDS